jgi:hypothetical protein
MEAMKVTPMKRKPEAIDLRCAECGADRGGVVQNEQKFRILCFICNARQAGAEQSK